MEWDLGVGASLLLALTIGFLFVAAVFASDDIFVDIVALVRRLKPGVLDRKAIERLNSLPERWIAIVVANWHEADVLEQMITGNIDHIGYGNYVIFLGVYPNDGPTAREAMRLAAAHEHVEVIVNPLPGPTSKGQMLNEIFREVIRREPELGIEFDLFLMQDTEDVIHPLSLKLLNSYAPQADFLQLPVFSLDVSLSSFVAGTYIDEFSEFHTKDLLVRQYLGGAIPSAGVGTALSRNLVLRLMARQNGQVLNENTLTEDYHLGMSAKDLGFRSRFLCFKARFDDGSEELIATREHFPRRFKASVHQRTRWTLGIAFQGARMIPFRGRLGHRYFLWRDRRGPANAIVIFFGWILFAVLVIERWLQGRVPTPFTHPVVIGLMAFDLCALFVRLVMKIRAVVGVHGARIALAIPIRWLLGNFIYSIATLRAFTLRL